jgi:hypothetical protein
VERRVDLSNIDLDEAAYAISERSSKWVEAGLSIEPVTWMDNDVPWPAPIVTDRAMVKRPCSLGVRVRRDGDAEAEFVLYAGGWADAAWLQSRGSEPGEEHVELESADDFGRLLDRVVAKLLTDL